MTFARAEKGRMLVDVRKMPALIDSFKAVADRNNSVVAMNSTLNILSIAPKGTDTVGMHRIARFFMETTGTTEKPEYEIAVRLRLRLDPAVLRTIEIIGRGKQVKPDPHKKGEHWVELAPDAGPSQKLTAQETAQAFWDAAARVETFLKSDAFVVSCSRVEALGRMVDEIIVGKIVGTRNPKFFNFDAYVDAIKTTDATRAEVREVLSLIANEHRPGLS